MSTFYIDQFYSYLQGVLIFQSLFFISIYWVTGKKEILYYSIFLIIHILYFYLNAPMTFFRIEDNKIFDLFWYENFNFSLLIGASFLYIQFLNQIFIENKNSKSERAFLLSSIGCALFYVLFIIAPYFQVNRSIFFYGAHLLTLPIGLFLLYSPSKNHISRHKLIRYGILSNIIGVTFTMIMIIRYNFGIRIYAFDEYPLMYMRIGFLFEIFIFQFVVLLNWYDKEKILISKDLDEKIKIEKLRNEIGRELHDDVGTSLSKISLQTYMAQNNAIGQPKITKYLIAIEHEIKSITNNLKDIVWSISSDKSHANLKHRIIDFLHSISQNSNIEIVSNIQLPDSDGLTDMKKNHHILLIIKESINNAIKHSNCKSINLICNKTFLSISDDGVGFDISNHYQGHGISNMEKRASEISGKFEITSSVSHGTTIKIQFNK